MFKASRESLGIERIDLKMRRLFLYISLISEGKKAVSSEKGVIFYQYLSILEEDSIFGAYNKTEYFFYDDHTVVMAVNRRAGRTILV